MRTFTVREKDLAATLLPGEVILERIQKIRKMALTAGQDFIKTGKGVFYAPAGVERMAEILRVAAVGLQTDRTDRTDEVKEDTLKGPARPTETPPLTQELMEGVMEVLPKKRVRVVKVFATNPKFLHAQATDAEEAMMTVRVQNNKNFAPGMEMEVVKGIGGVWDYVGFLPRARGRW